MTVSPKTAIEALTSAGVDVSKDVVGIWHAPIRRMWFVSLGDWALEETASKVRQVLGPKVQIEAEAVPDVKKFPIQVKGIAYKPFASRVQWRKCFQADDPRWDCRKWAHETSGGKVTRFRQLPFRKKEGPRQGGVIIAVWLPTDVAEKVYRTAVEVLGEEVAVPADELHVTLEYLGTQDELREMMPDLLMVFLNFGKDALSNLQGEPIRGRIGGVGKFFGEDPEKLPVYLSVDSRDLTRARGLLDGEFEELEIESTSEHGFVPHITVGYVSKDDSPSQIVFDPIEVSFDTLYFVVGETKIPFPLTRDSQRSFASDESIEVKSLTKFLSMKGERLAPGVTRISGDRCNVHGRWGSCSAAGFGSPPDRGDPKEFGKRVRGRKRVPSRQIRYGVEPKKGGKGGGGGKSKGGGGKKGPAPPKGSGRGVGPEGEKPPEELSREQVRAQNLSKTLTELGIPQEGLDILSTLREGGTSDISREELDKGGFIQAGLVEEGANGQFRLTSSGWRLLNAAESGDLQRTEDVMASSRDRLASQMERESERLRQQEERRSKMTREEPKAKPKPKGRTKPKKDTLNPKATKVLRRIRQGKLTDEERELLIKSGLARPSWVGGRKTFVLTPRGRSLLGAAPKVSLPTSSKSVWSASFVNDLPDSAFLFIESGGRKDDQGKTVPRSLRHLPYRDQNGDIDLPHLRNVLSRLPQMASRRGLDREEIRERVSKLLEEEQEGSKTKRRGGSHGMISEGSPIVKKSALIVYKGPSGDHRWVLYTSNPFQDRDEEFVTLKALEDDVDRWWEEGSPPTPLRWWHVGKPYFKDLRDWTTVQPGPGADLGVCDFRALHGLILVESGTFKSAQIGRAVARSANELEASLGFAHPPTEPDREGGFLHIKSFERSLTPRKEASNIYTALATQPTTKGRKHMDSARLEALRSLGIDPEGVLDGAEEIEQKARSRRTPLRMKSADDDETEYEEGDDDIGSRLDSLTQQLANLQASLKAGAEEEQEERFEDLLISELTVGELQGVLNSVISTKSVEPIGQAFQVVLEELQEIKGLLTSKSVQSVVDQVSKMRAQIERLQARTKGVTAKVRELEDGAPRIAARGIRPSEVDDTIFDFESEPEVAQKSSSNNSPFSWLDEFVQQ